MHGIHFTGHHHWKDDIREFLKKPNDFESVLVRSNLKRTITFGVADIDGIFHILAAL